MISAFRSWSLSSSFWQRRDSTYLAEGSIRLLGLRVRGVRPFANLASFLLAPVGEAGGVESFPAEQHHDCAATTGGIGLSENPLLIDCGKTASFGRGGSLPGSADVSRRREWPLHYIHSGFLSCSVISQTGFVSPMLARRETLPPREAIHTRARSTKRFYPREPKAPPSARLPIQSPYICRISHRMERAQKRRIDTVLIRSAICPSVQFLDA